MFNYYLYICSKENSFDLIFCKNLFIKEPKDIPKCLDNLST